MAKFLTTSGVSSKIETIIKEAKSKVVLVSPFLQINNNIYERLIDASKSGKKIFFIYREDHLYKTERAKLYQLENVHLYHHSTLHAKCYLNEKEVLITSMNLYEFSEKNNREMGVVLYKSTDEESYIDAVKEIESLKNNAIDINLSIKKLKEQKQKGNCIRCGESIKYNTEKPFCRNCYEVWDSYANPFYEENYCHKCGKKEDTSMEKPECYKCYTS